MRLDTKCIHGGVFGDPHTGAVSVPIYQVSTYKQEGIGQHRGYEYSRTGNPTRAALEQLIAELENGTTGLAFASGMAAISTVVSLFNQGDHLVVGDDVYGGTYRVLSCVFSRMGIEVTHVDTSRPDQVREAIRETHPGGADGNPQQPAPQGDRYPGDRRHLPGTGSAPDRGQHVPHPVLAKSAGSGGGHRCPQRHQVFGRTQRCGGRPRGRQRRELGERLHFLQNSIGGVLGPNDAWLLIRGIKTLGLRMRQHESNARRIAEWLRERSDIAAVYYPGLPDHPGHDSGLPAGAGLRGDDFL